MGNSLENISNCEVDVKQVSTDAREEITISLKEHIVIAGIGVAFSIILFLLSFLV